MLKTKILIGILIFGFISGGVLFVLYMWGIIPPWKPGPPIFGAVILIDKTEYKRGETVKITVNNYSDRLIWYNKETCPPFCVQLQKLENGEWINVNMAMPVVSDLPVRASSLRPNEEVMSEWDMFIVKPDDQRIMAESGQYRFSFSYGFSKDNFDKYTAYSNEFTIKEEIKREVKNCDLYEIPMTGEQIKECICPEGYKKFYRLSGAYCATDSRKPCKTHTDCPEGEHCISSDRESWFCTGQFAGCYYRNPENPEEPMLCAD